MPAVGREFHASTPWTAWLLTSFLLVSCVAAPLLGRLGDHYGKRQVLLLATGVLLVGSIVAALGATMGAVIVGRALQGVGGAVIPLGFSIVRDEFPPRRVARAVAVQAASLPVGMATALVLGGVLDAVSWRLLIGLGAGAAGLAVVLILRYVPSSPTRVDAPLDLEGAALLTAGLVSLLVALTQGAPWGWTSGRMLGLLTVAGGSLGAWVWIELRTATPMVEIRMLTHRPVMLTNAATWLTTGFAITGALVLVPLLLAGPRGITNAADNGSYGFHANTGVVGLYMLMWALGGLSASVGGRLIGRRFGAKWPLVVGAGAISVGLAFMAGWHDAPWQVVLALLLQGFGLPLVTGASAQLVIESVEQTQTGIALGMNNVSRQVGGVIGAQVGAAILATHTIAFSRAPAESAFVVSLVLCAAAGALGAALGLFVAPRTRQRAAAAMVAATSATPVR